MSDIVKVTVKQNHFGSKGMHYVGDTVELTRREAEEKKHFGLVDFDGEGKAPKAGDKILVQEPSAETTTAIVENGSDEMQPVSKAGLEQAKSMQKAERKKSGK